MNTITGEFTKEQLIERLRHGIAVAAKYPDLEQAQLDAAIFKIALASLEAEPVHQVFDESGGWFDIENGDVVLEGDDGNQIRTLYAAPPAPANAKPVAWMWSHRKHPSEVSLVRPEDDERAEGAHWSGWSCQALYAAPPAPVSVPTFEEWCERTEQKPVGWVRDAMKEAYDGCRAAMLQGAEPVTTAYKLPEETGSSLQLRNLIRQRHAEWSQATFGDVGPIGPLKHLSKEALEAAAEPDDLSEWADMQFLLWDAQRRAGISDGEITTAMEEKLKVNMARQWPEPKDGEPRLHIKSTPHREGV